MRAIQMLAMAAVAALVSSPVGASGPYVWIDTKTEVLFDSDNAVAALRETWVFDFNYTKLALNGIKREAETATVTDLAPLARTNVTSLAEYGYFVVAEMDGKKTLFR